jgi:hypothetical protein
MNVRVVIVAVSLLVGWGCAAGPRIPTDIGTQPTSAYGWNIGAGDLLDPVTASCRLGVYLDELTAAGYAKQIRIVYTPSVGPFIFQHWIPVIRAKGFRVLIILYQSRGDANMDAQRDWILTGLPPIADLLDGVQISNEVDRPAFNDFSPSEYLVFHRYVSMVVRSVVPGVPIIGPDIQSTDGSVRFIADSKLIYGQDYDIVSMHVQRQSDEQAVMAFTQHAARLTGTAHPRIWATEGDYGQAPWLTAHGYPVERVYVYVWNCNAGAHGEQCEWEMRRPGGGAVAVCETSK